MATVHVNACIVGGGPAGLVLGLLLARRGVSVLVLEGHETFDREFRGEVLQPGTAHLLDELGLLDHVLEQPHSILKTGVVRQHGHDIGAFDFQRISPAHPYAIWMPQTVFLSALTRKAEALPTFQCWMGSKVSRLIRDDGKVMGVAGLRHGAELFEVRADVVVGADGRYSEMATLGGFTAAYEHHDFDLIWFSIEQPRGWAAASYVSLGDQARGLMLPQYPHHVQAGFALPTGDWKRMRQQGVEAVADHVRRFDPIFAELAAGLRDFTPFFPVEGLIRLVDDWAQDGLLLIGDAAHTMSPAGLIGVDVAIATAAVAAQVIAPRLGRGTVSRQALREVQRLREADVRMLHRLQLHAQRVLLGQDDAGGVVRWLAPRPPTLLSRIQQRLFFGVPLPPLDPAFSFKETHARYKRTARAFLTERAGRR
jgi:2-polyprenyl-6-methoxyphenol hydroxylase-like FAD-dependent oxidoreductase